MANHEKLGDEQQREFAKIIRFFADIVHDRTNSWRNWACTEIQHILWCWTAAAFNSETRTVTKSGVAKHDLVHASDAAWKLVGSRNIKGVRHEHVVPRKWLAELIVNKEMDDEQILRLLQRCCIAALVTKEEHENLKPRASMPDGWDWERGDVFVRYKEVPYLYEQVRTSRSIKA